MSKRDFCINGGVIRVPATITKSAVDHLGQQILKLSRLRFAVRILRIVWLNHSRNIRRPDLNRREYRVSGTCVIGLQWGDEAKGKLVDLLTDGMELVVRYQGGANAGHTVVIGDEVYKLHHIPSGIINEGVTNIISTGVVINPPTILDEIEMLAGRGIDVSSRMKISSRAHVVMPWHVLEDKMWNRLVTGEDNIGSTLRGIGPCYADKIGRSFAIRMGDMIRDDFAERVRKIVAVKTKVLSAAGSEENQLSGRRPDHHRIRGLCVTAWRQW